MKIQSAKGPHRPLNVGDRGRDVLRVERALQKLGYRTGKVDGRYTQATAAAVRGFKRDEQKIHNTRGYLRVFGQNVLLQRAGGTAGNETGKATTIRALGFNWPARYHKGGVAGDEATLDRLKKQSDVLGLTEFKWGGRIKGGEKGWSFYHPDPKNDGQKGLIGQALAWNDQKFKLVDKGTHLLNKPTLIQQRAAGPTRHQGKSIVWAKLKDRKTGEVFTVGVVHFVPSKHLGGAAERLWKKQRDGVVDWFRKNGRNTILMGDFNGQWHDRVARPLHKVAHAQTAKSHGNRQIDWVLRSKDLRGVGGGTALSNGGQSDHKPVRGVIRG